MLQFPYIVSDLKISNLEQKSCGGRFQHVNAELELGKRLNPLSHPSKLNKDFRISHCIPMFII